MLTGAISVLRSDVQHTRDLKHKVEQTVQDTIVATRIVEGFRNSQQNGQYLKTYANFPLEFFNRVTEQMRERLRWYKTTIEVRLSIAVPASGHLILSCHLAHRAQTILCSITAAVYTARCAFKAVLVAMWV